MLELDELFLEEGEPLLESKSNSNKRKNKMDSVASTSGSVSTVGSEAPLTRRDPADHRRVQISTSAQRNTLNRSNSNGPKTPFIIQCVGGLYRCLTSCWSSSDEFQTREFRLGKPTTVKYAPNVIKNQKYNFITFLPLVSKSAI